MKPSFYFLILFATLLTARENPFVPLPIPEEQIAVPELEQEAGEERGGQTVNFEQIRFLFSAGQVRIETKDALKKHFMVQEPARIVLDFKADDDFPTRKRLLSVPPFQMIRLGAHSGYYRAVLELEGLHGYSVDVSKYGYLLTLK